MMPKVRVLLFSFLFFTVQAIAEKPTFKMHIRLWNNYHEKDTLSAQLLSSLKKYPGFCDEVWFLVPCNAGKPVNETAVKKMKHMAEEMRKLGIVPSVQAHTVGHPDPNNPVDKGISWGTMVGADGVVTRSQGCPRQRGLWEDLARIFTPYAEACQPHGFWLDDDLRMTFHDPAKEGCYCDTCIALFNRLHHYSYSRASLVKALAQNVGEGKLRREWIAFGQESMAELAAAVARAVHKVSPKTAMGLQHANFCSNFLEGYDWNPIFDAFEHETGVVPLSRPGHGYYKDHAPRGMLKKGLDIGRQVSRLNGNITEIAPEVEGFIHKATGKSPHSLCIETMYYLAFGATQMSYSIIASAKEPMDWYADNYFKALQKWHEYAKEYVDYNWGSVPGGIDPYISPNLPYRNLRKGENDMAWAYTDAGKIYDMVPLGIPFCPDGAHSVALMLDAAGAEGMSDKEISSLMLTHNLVLDNATWNVLQQRHLTQHLKDVSRQTGLQGVRCLEAGNGRRMSVVSYNADITGKERLMLLHAIDWASGNKLPAIIESMAQAALVPRVNTDGSLRSVAVLNCTISEQESYTLRLRVGKDNDREPRFVWKHNGHKDRRLKAERIGKDYIVSTPSLEGWNFAWIAVE